MEEKNRERILEIAWELFNYYGYRNVTISDLARHLGSSKRYVYKYFPSKEQIAEEVIAAFVDNFVEYSQALKIAGVNPLERLQKLIDFFKDHLNQINPLFIEDINKFAPTLRDRVIGLHQKRISVIEEIIKEGQELGQIDKVDSRMAALVFTNLVTLVLVKEDKNFSQYGYGFSTVELSEFISKMILAGLRTGR